MAARNNYVSARPGSALGNPAALFEPVELIVGALPAGQFVDVPGPAAGSVRALDLFAVSAVFGAPATATGVTLRPGGQQLHQPVGFSNTQGFTRIVLGPGESARVTNGGANAVNVSATYIDLMDTWITLVREDITNAIQTIIPVPNPGFQSRWLQLPAVDDSSSAQTNTQRTIETKVAFFNADTVTHAIEQESGGIIVGRTTNVPTLNKSNLTGVMQAPVKASTGPLRLRTAAAIVTTPVFLYGAYETLPL